MDNYKDLVGKPPLVIYTALARKVGIDPKNLFFMVNMAAEGSLNDYIYTQMHYFSRPSPSGLVLHAEIEIPHSINKIPEFGWDRPVTSDAVRIAADVIATCIARPETEHRILLLRLYNSSEGKSEMVRAWHPEYGSWMTPAEDYVKLCDLVEKWESSHVIPDSRLDWLKEEGPSKTTLSSDEAQILGLAKLLECYKSDGSMEAFEEIFRVNSDSN